MGASVEAKFLEGLRQLEVIGPEIDDWSRISELVLRYADLPFAGTDASVVASAERLETSTIITLDERHFRSLPGGAALVQFLYRHRNGYMQYCGVSGNSQCLKEYFRAAGNLLFKWSNRRSQRRSLSWAKYSALLYGAYAWSFLAHPWPMGRFWSRQAQLPLASPPHEPWSFLPVTTTPSVMTVETISMKPATRQRHCNKIGIARCALCAARCDYAVKCTEFPALDCPSFEDMRVLPIALRHTCSADQP